jgi:hypothetical protein
LSLGFLVTLVFPGHSKTGDYGVDSVSKAKEQSLRYWVYGNPSSSRSLEPNPDARKILIESLNLLRDVLEDVSKDGCDPPSRYKLY